METVIFTILFGILVAGIYLGLTLLNLGTISERAPFVPKFSTRKHRIFYGSMSLFMIIGSSVIIYLGFIDLSSINETESNIGKLVEPISWQVETGGNLPVESEIKDYPIVNKLLTSVVAENVILSSTRSPDSYTSPVNSIRYKWYQPFTDVVPAGLVYQIYISPASEDENDIIFCNPIIAYDFRNGETYEYNGVEQYVAFNKLNTIVWDLTGIIWTTENKDWQNLVPTLLDEGHSFFSPATRLREKFFYKVVVEKNDNWRLNVDYVGLQCIVTASSEYTVDANPDFRGDIALVNAYVVPQYLP